MLILAGDAAITTPRPPRSPPARRRSSSSPPTEVTRRLPSLGSGAGYDERVAVALAGFVAGSHTWLTVERSTGAKAAETTYHDIYAGTVAPSIGKIVSLHDD